MMNTFGDKLKAIRTYKDMTQQDMADLVGLTKSAISQFETGKISPRLDTVRDMAVRMNIDMSLLINPEVSVDLLLTTLGLIDDESLLSSKNEPAINKIIRNCGKINFLGQDAVATYSEALFRSGMYPMNFTEQKAAAEDQKQKAIYNIEPEEVPLKEDHKRLQFDSVPSYLNVAENEAMYSIDLAGQASAGPGFIYGDTVDEQYQIVTTEIPAHDFAIKVTGDSMLPTIEDGSVCFVKQDHDYHDGDIYLIDRDGETFVKRVYFEKDRLTLVSDNDAYDDIIINGGDIIDHAPIKGRIVGYLMPRTK